MNRSMADTFDRFRRMPVMPPPHPWRHVATHGIGGQRNVGFGSGTELLLVESSDGRGVFDCATGERVARDRTDHIAWDDEVALRAVGIGPLEGVVVRMAGLQGGGLPTATPDGWHVEVVCPDWPEAAVILEPSEALLWDEGRAGGCVKICQVEALRACGFSDSGRSLVVAEGSHTLYLFHRP